MKSKLEVACLLAMAWSNLSQSAERPNFLFIYADDHRYDALSVVQHEQGERGRFPWVQTPNLDRLAADGVRFRQAFVVCSLCAPSRAVYLTGRYNHFNGIASNFRPFPVDNVTHATLLRAAGYTTGYIGKWHMGNQRERPGFDYHASYLGHARYVDPTFVVNGQDRPMKGWIDDLATDFADEFLREQSTSKKPWSLIVGFKSPHGPYEPPPRAKDRFAGKLARAVPNLNARPTYLPERTAAAAPSSGEVPVNLEYMRCISAIDDCVGRLLETLDKLNLAQNTVVIYASDNGFYNGEHGLGDKRSAYDESLRIPFIVRWPATGPAARGRVDDRMVLNLDLAPTLLDIGGVSVPKEMQGTSWRGLLTDTAMKWREAWFYEYFAEKQRNARVPDITAARTADAKLIKYPGHDDWTELFDLRSDPYESRNLFADPSHAALRQRMEAEHSRLLTEVGYRVPDFVDRPEWWPNPPALPKGR